MALAVPEAMLTMTPTMHPRNDESDSAKWKLPRTHKEDLRDVARGVEESNVGIACKYLVDAMSGAGHADVDSDGYLNHLDAVERFCDRFDVWSHPHVKNWRNRIKRCRRALDRLQRDRQHTTVAVLHVAYGYPDPIVAQFAEQIRCRFRKGEHNLASLVRYTNVVEERRKLLVKIERARYEEERRFVDVKKPKGEGALQQMNRASAVVEESTRQRIADLSRVRTIATFAERVITSADALRDLLQPITRETREDDEMWSTKKRAMQDDRANALSTMHIEASQMLQAAEKVYHVAWLASAT